MEVRIMDEKGELYYCRWCNKHSHGLTCGCKESSQWKEISKLLSTCRKRYQHTFLITPFKQELPK